MALLVTCSAMAQVSGRAQTSGGQAASFATVTLHSNTDSTFTRSVLSNDAGEFIFSGISKDLYFISIKSLGYQTVRSVVFQLDDAHPTYNTGTLTLQPADRQLSEVVIRASKPVVRQQEGGLVVDAQASILTKGSTVMQVLARSPGVLVDVQTGAISLNGKSGVMLMIDGKLLRMPAAQANALLAGMQADNIDKIELLSTPPAKYDADGNAGLINIVTKKNKKRGMSGSVSVSAGYGRGEKLSGDANVTYNAGKLSLNGEYGYYRSKGYGLLLAEGTENVPLIGGQTEFHYNGQWKPTANSHNFGAGADYRLSTKTTIGGRFYVSKSAGQNKGHNFGNYLLPDSNLVFDSQLLGNTHSTYSHQNAYLQSILSAAQQLSIDLDHFGHQNNGITSVQSNFSNSLFAPTQRSLANSNINVWVAKADYSDALSKSLKLESGVKGTFTSSKSVAGIENLVNGQWQPIGAGTSNDLGTRENILAAYTTLALQVDSLTKISAGGRYEYSHNYTSHSLNAEFAVDRKVKKLFPSIFITRKLNATDELQLSYTERITRPSFNDLASYVSYNDPVSVFTGNPALKPTITRNLKLGYQLHDYVLNLVYSHDTNPILGVQALTGPTEGLVYLKPANADWQRNLTLQAVIPVKVASWWEMNYSLLAGWHQYRVSFFPSLLQKGYTSWSVNFTESFKLPKSFSAELSGNYYSSGYDSNLKIGGNGVINLGLKKELGNQNGTLQLSVADVFGTSFFRSHMGTLVTDSFNSNVHVQYRPESNGRPIFRLSYTRPLGISVKKQERKDGGNEERSRM
ncbi:hypothetical protein BC343_22385 [Mucilaginibacter pedocola]|uniref:Outer membrane protein beta-barrel domain-containing protein n=2 Tax=Mucilaginibacter pedocola TaxID=1792845 RepID=A0A1S9PJQ1_9SPHI|nr:hypothetical protein BC343_22385 [Mucilaginibacter pedocola]